ncbi:hypothetical protein AVEN_179863-1 [Araneus ventricosus]|uniref:CCHC-type domain-containing protein n=1 Tax=Araneus ventricosus TaxID=182803 RepID=A0A4Y2CJG0_ARAVE|nr:hypothetical protein AVEN_30382-1 [Araneus ventricosus]GBM04483.1 hypothetical protein AVEN_179863-1 [Araneus ventricosus]
MPETGPLTRSMDKQFEKLFAMMAEMKAGQEGLERKMEAGQEGLERKMEAGQEEMRVAQAGLEQKMEAGQEEMRSGQERMEKGQEEMKGLIDEVKSEVQRKIDEVEEKVQMKIEDVKSEVKGKFEEVEHKVQGKIEEVEHKVQGKIGDIERRLSELEIRPFIFKTQFDVVSSTNGWTDFVKASQLVASLRGSAAEVLQGIPADKLTDLTTIEKALEYRFGDSHLTQFYRTELKTRRQKPGESLQELAADVERLMSLAYAECPLDVRESLAAQYFVDAIRDEDTQHSTRLMDAKDLKSSLAYSMKYEAARTVSKTSRHVRSIETEDHMSRERDDKFEFFFNRLKKLLNSSVAGKKNTPRRNSNVTCWKCNKKGHVQRECQAIASNQEN